MYFNHFMKVIYNFFDMNLNNFDALIVLSNHMNSSGELNSESKSRADKAAAIFKQNMLQNNNLWMGI